MNRNHFTGWSELEFKKYKISMLRQIRYYESRGDNIEATNLKRRIQREEREWWQTRKFHGPDKSSEYKRIQELLRKHR